MVTNAETAINQPKFNICLINPALLPEWFWLPVAYQLEAEGQQVYVPDLPRSNMSAGVSGDVDAISQTMGELDNQFIVSLSRGVESGLRYISKLRRENRLNRVIGWMVMSSVGPQGYKVNRPGLNISRHTSSHREGIRLDDDGFEILDPAVARQYLLYDIDNEWLRRYTSENLIKQRPLTREEIEDVPHLPHRLIPTKWYIGRNDRVDNLELSAAVAEQDFGVKPTYTDWGHVGPLTHTEEVAKAILREANACYKTNLPEPLRRLITNIKNPRYSEQPDSFMYMMLRRTINQTYAEHRVDFNLEGLKAAKQFFAHRELSRQDLIVDIGSSSGEFIASAAEKIGIQTRIVGIEPDEETFIYLPPQYKGNITLIKAYGEDIPLPTNSATVTSAHNVAFRAGNFFSMLSEMRRITVPGGLIVISTNARGHAQERHHYERQVANIVAEQAGIEISLPSEPAEGFFLEDVPMNIEEVDGLEVIEELGIKQDTRALITRQRLDNYLLSIIFSYNRTNLPWWPHSKVWREVVYSVVKPDIEKKIEQQAESDRRQGIKREPFFADTIKRGMIAVISK